MEHSYAPDQKNLAWTVILQRHTGIEINFECLYLNSSGTAQDIIMSVEFKVPTGYYYGMWKLCSSYVAGNFCYLDELESC